MFSKQLGIISALFITSCQTATNEYELILEDGIYIEQFDENYVEENRYNANNKIFKEGNRFKYSFEYLTPENETLYFKSKFNEWEFVQAANIDSTTLRTVTIKVEKGNPTEDGVSNYNQTVLGYYLKANILYCASWSGVIENEKNVWMHPPRDQLFEILELNPFPYIQAPYEVGTKWKWSLDIGSQWGDERWATWKTSIRNEYDYEITDKKIITTELGDLECFIIDATATSELGETKLKAFFNSEHGFVRLNYINIDSSRINLELFEHLE